MRARLLNNKFITDFENDMEYGKIHSAIINSFEYNESEAYLESLCDSELRVYEGIDYSVILDAWFSVGHIFSGRCGKGACCLEGASIKSQDNKFTIVPPCGYEEYFNNFKLTYDDTVEGMIEAFLNTPFKEYVKQIDKDYFICTDEI